MKKILVTTDLSDGSQAAFAAAREQALAFKASVLLLAIIEDPAQAAMIYAFDFPVQPDSEVQSQVEEKLQNDLQTFAKEHFDGVKVETRVVAANGPVHAEILNCATEEGIDMIVMSTHGRTGLSRMIIGSITERVVREAECPILTIPGGEKKTKLLDKIKEKVEKAK